MNSIFDSVQQITGRFHFLLNSNVVWLNKKNTDSGVSEPTCKKFIRTFSYVDSTSTCFNHSEIKFSDSILLAGEHYGGQGIGLNGGGARCGNLGDYQIKGVGTNLLIGRNTPRDHSYGGLDLETAIVETIYTNVLNEALPIGAIEVVGLIYTGANTGFQNKYGDDAIPGALLVRKACLRPAHFIQAPNFQPTEEYKQLYLSDVHRTKQVNKSLKKHFSSDVDYIKYLGQFLANCANQFALARVLGIAHRTISPSNISFDGKWLDVPMTTFMGGGIDRESNTSFYNEPKLILKIIDELTYTYSKYNRVRLNVRPLVNYYQSQFNAYQKYYLATLFGLPEGTKKSETMVEWDSLFSFINCFIKKETVVYTEAYAQEKKPPMYQLTLLLYQSIYDANQASTIASKRFKFSVSDFLTLFKKFKKIIVGIHQETAPKTKFDHFVLACLIKVIKRGGFIRFFNRGNGIAQGAEELANNVDIKGINHLIEECDNTAKWIFDYSAEDETIVFSSRDVNIRYYTSTGIFIVCHGHNTFEFDQYNELILWVNKQKSALFIINKFNFKTNLQDLSVLNLQFETALT